MMLLRTIPAASLCLMAIAACQSAPQTDGAAANQPFRLVVLHTNDHHGHPLRFEDYPMKDVGGLPARATLVAEVRKQAANVLLIDAGDMNTGRPESLFFDGEPDIRGYNALGYDAVALGNHEFDKGLPVLQKQIAAAKFKFVNANLSMKKDQPIPGVLPYVVKEFPGARVVIFGLMCQDAASSLGPNAPGILMEDDVGAANRMIPLLRQSADLVIALTHCGVFDDDSAGSRRLAKLVSGIDLIVDGHTHTRMEKPLFVTNDSSKRAVPIVQAGQWGEEVGRTEITWERGKVPSVSFKAIPINLKNVTKNEKGEKIQNIVGVPLEDDRQVLAQLQPYADKIDALLGETIGIATGDFEDADVRLKETPLGNLVADATLDFARPYGAVLAVQNGGGIRARIGKGPISKKAIYESLPFDNSVVVVSLWGHELRAMFDLVAAQQPGSPSFLQIAGAKVTFKRSTGKATAILVGGKSVVDSKLYKIATNSYLAGGGDGFDMLKVANGKYDTSAFTRDVVIKYLQARKTPLVPKTTGRVVFAK